MEVFSRLKRIGELPDNWNNHGASAFSGDILDKVKPFLASIPELINSIFISPTANNSIQLEIERDDGIYCEVEIFNHKFQVYAEKDGKEILSESCFTLVEAVKYFKEVVV